MSWVTLYKLTFCDFEAHQSDTRLHKSNACTQILSSDSIYEFGDSKVWNSWHKLITCIKKHVVLLVIETLINIGLPQQSFWCNVGSTAHFSLSELYN